MRALLVALLASACGGRAVGTTDAAPAPDAAPGDAGPFAPGPEPTSPLRPVPGEVTVYQLDLPPGAALKSGEAELIVGPDGTLVLIDTGNSSHDDDIRALIYDLDTSALTPERGFPARTPRQVDWVVLTHFHGDHIGGFSDLLLAGAPLEGVRGVVHRGFVDVGAALNASDYGDLCTALRGGLAALDLPLCVADTPAPCDAASFVGAYPALACPGLLAGDLADPGDDGDGVPAYLDLGGGARLTFLAADARLGDGRAASPFGVSDDNNEENARSLVFLLTYGCFRMHFGGDLTGSGETGVPDVETFLVGSLGADVYGARGVDVVHVHHHARDTSSNAAFVALTAPLDGRARNLVAGISPAYLGSPYAAVLARWLDGDRLAGGRFWVPEVAAGGASADALVVAGGPVILQTLQAGLGYRVQAAGATLSSAAYPSVACSP